MTYRRTLAEYLRIDRPPSDIAWMEGMVVAVTPMRIDAPDIIEIVMERSGRKVVPTENRLKPIAFTNPSGEQSLIHAGEVRFPVPGLMEETAVTVSTVPRSGAPFVATIGAAPRRLSK